MMALSTRILCQLNMGYVIILLTLLRSFPIYGVAVTEIFNNPGFEDTTIAHSWKCSGGCILSLSDDSHFGHHSAKVTNRTHNWSGVRQTVSLQGGNRYVVKGYIKLLNMSPGHMYHTVKMIATYDINGKRLCQSTILPNGGVMVFDDPVKILLLIWRRTVLEWSSKPKPEKHRPWTSELTNFLKIQVAVTGHGHFHTISIMHMLQKEFGWTEIGGDFDIPSGVSTVNIYPEIENVDVNYLIDDMSLQQLLTNSSWKQEANQRIESLRKGQLIVRSNMDPSFLYTGDLNPLFSRVNNSASMDTSNMEIHVKQLKHDFAFGSSVGAEMIVDPAYLSYQQFYYNNFEWGVIANKLKWEATQHTQTHKDYDTPMRAVTALKSHGKTVRGHNMFWDIPKHNPSWLNSLSKDQLLAAMHTRVNDTLSHTKGKLAHWDVNNENLHGDYFEQKLKYPNITFDMFRWIHQIEPGVKLFLNDYHITVTGLYTTAYKTQAKIMTTSRVPVYGMGIQSHFTSSNIDFDAVKYRLDKVSEAGLPLWITELSIIDTDNNRKADALEDVLTLYFSYPNVQGILLWGMWDCQTFDTRTAIVNGPNVTPNAAGLRYQKLFKNTWRTDITQQLHHGIHINGFHGNYVLNIMHNGKVIEKKYFHLGAGGKVVTVHLNGTVQNSREKIDIWFVPSNKAYYDKDKKDSHGQALSTSVFG